MLSVPRDELVQIPGYGQNKINAAFSYGGVKLCLQVVKQFLGIPINDFVYVDFDGFEKVVEQTRRRLPDDRHALLQQHRHRRLGLD